MCSAAKRTCIARNQSNCGSAVGENMQQGEGILKSLLIHNKCVRINMQFPLLLSVSLHTTDPSAIATIGLRHSG